MIDYKAQTLSSVGWRRGLCFLILKSQEFKTSEKYFHMSRGIIIIAFISIFLQFIGCNRKFPTDTEDTGHFPAIIKGTVYEMTSTRAFPSLNASIKLFYNRDSLSTLSNLKGAFELSITDTFSVGRFKISKLGFKNIDTTINFIDTEDQSFILIQMISYMPIESGNIWEYDAKYSTFIYMTEKCSKGIEVWKILNFDRQTLKGSMQCSFDGFYYEMDHETKDTLNVEPAFKTMIFPIRIENDALIVGDYPPNMESGNILEHFPTITSDHTVIICFPFIYPDTIERRYNVHGGPAGRQYTIEKNIGFKYFHGNYNMGAGGIDIWLNLRAFHIHNR